MQRPQARPPNTNMNLMHPPYPPLQYQAATHGAPPPPSAPPQSYTATRPRDWDNNDPQNMYEPDSKRMRPFAPNLEAAAFPNQSSSYNRHNPSVIPPPNPNMGPPGPFNSQQRPPMLQHNPIHPPNQEALSFHQRQASYPQNSAMPIPYRGPMQPLSDDRQVPSSSQFPGQPPSAMPGRNAYDQLPAPPRKDFRQSGTEPNALASAAGSAAAKSATGPESDTSDEPMSFKDFLLKQPDNISSHAAQEAYDEYVKEFTRQKPNKFFDLHKDEEWFKERYDPDYVSKRMVRIEKEVQERAKIYRDVWERGGSAVCAPKLVAPSDSGRYSRKGHHGKPEEHPHSPTSPEKKEDQPADDDKKAKKGVDVVKEEKDTEQKALATNEETHSKDDVDDAVVDCEGQGNVQMAADEDALVAKQEIKPEEAESDAKISDESAVGTDERPIVDEKHTGMPSDDDLRIHEGADAERKEERETEDLNSSSIKSKSGSQPLVLPLRREHQKDTIFMRGIPLNLRRDDLTHVLKHGGDGSQNFALRRLKLGDINPQRNLERFGWAVYDSEETAASALETIKGVKVVSPKIPESGSDEGSEDTQKNNENADDERSRTYVIDCMLNLERRKKFFQGRVLPPIFGSAERIAFDIDQSVKMMRCLDSLRKINPDLNPLTDQLLASLENDGRRLDHIVTYLREVHYFCYYSGNEFLEDPTSMPPQELRPVSDRGRSMSDADNRLLRRIDERAKWVLDRDYDRPRSNSDNGDVAVESAVRVWLNAHTKNEGQGRYRCGLPPHKLFKGPEFVHKHLRTKHADKMNAVREKALLDVYRANFENDASKDEVIKIYHEGLTGGKEDEGNSGTGSNPTVMMGNAGNNFGQPGVSMPIGMYNPYMGMGMQPFPLMMNPAAGFAPGYPTAAGYANPMAFAGRGMNAGAVSGPGMAPTGMMHGAGRGVLPGGPPSMHMHRRPPPRRDSGPRDSGPRGRRSGLRRGGVDHYRGGHDGPPPDPRSRGNRRAYNDLDAPSNSTFDLVRYDDV